MARSTVINPTVEMDGILVTPSPHTSKREVVNPHVVLANTVQAVVLQAVGQPEPEGG